MIRVNSHDFIDDGECADPVPYVHAVRCRRCGLVCMEGFDKEYLFYEDDPGYCAFRHLTDEELDCDVQLMEAVMES